MHPQTQSKITHAIALQYKRLSVSEMKSSRDTNVATLKGGALLTVHPSCSISHSLELIACFHNELSEILSSEATCPASSKTESAQLTSMILERLASSCTKKRI